MSTSLNVVSIAVSFFTATKRRAIVLRRLVIFTRSSARPAADAFAAGAAVEAAAGFAAAAGAAEAFTASSFVIRPSLPEPATADASTPFSFNILPAAGEA